MRHLLLMAALILSAPLAHAEEQGVAVAEFLRGVPDDEAP